MKKSKNKNKMQKKAKIGVIFLSILLILVLIAGFRTLNRVIHVGNITKIESEEQFCTDMILPVYSDFFYVYFQGNGCTNYVYYKNGSKEPLSAALFLNHLSVNDLEKFDFSLR